MKIIDKITYEIHELVNNLDRLSLNFYTQDKPIPRNGIYLLFEKGEKLDSLDRIVRIGTHRGENQLKSRLKQHFINKNRSIFRKNIGRCLLNKEENNYISTWNLDMTSKVSKLKYSHIIDKNLEQVLETKISQYIEDNLSFAVFEVEEKEQRLFWESRLISTIAQSQISCPSKKWLGNFSPLKKIRESGLWQVQELNNAVLSKTEFKELQSTIRLSI